MYQWDITARCNVAEPSQRDNCGFSISISENERKHKFIDSHIAHESVQIAHRTLKLCRVSQRADKPFEEKC